jgi:hypothetical protein
MKFIVSRTSEWNEENKPCEEAFRFFVDTWEERACTEEYFNKKFSVNKI